MLYREIIAVCSQIHTKHTSTPCGQNVELLNVKLAVYTLYIDHSAVYILTIGPHTVKAIAEQVPSHDTVDAALPFVKRRSPR
jgi:hypothetical protein